MGLTSHDWIVAFAAGVAVGLGLAIFAVYVLDLLLSKEKKRPLPNKRPPDYPR
jgi:hypothetical protein